MVGLATILFLVAALGGMLLAFQRYKSGKNPTLMIGVIHGTVAFVALVILGIAVSAGPKITTATTAFFFLMATALWGVFLLTHRLRGEVSPLPAVGIHALFAVISVVVLIFAQL
jgi:uncharacterized membrane protein